MRCFFAHWSYQDAINQALATHKSLKYNTFRKNTVKTALFDESYAKYSFVYCVLSTVSA